MGSVSLSDFDPTTSTGLANIATGGLYELQKEPVSEMWGGLTGEDEKEAYKFVWVNRKKLGWTKEKYGRSVVWKNVRKQTKEFAPNLFICEFSEFNDCTE